MQIKDQSVKDFLGDVASSRPTPGGGAVAAVSAAIAASLVEMVANLTIGKKDYLGVEGRMKNLAEEMAQARSELLDLADADSDAFDKVMEAYKTKDKSKIKAALYWAIEIPKKVVDFATNIQNAAVEVSKIGNKNTYSDAMSAEYLANAALEAAEENIIINTKVLASLKED